MHILLLPLAIIAFLVFLLVVGAIALWLAMALISIVIWIVTIPVRLHRWRLRRKGARAERSKALSLTERERGVWEAGRCRPNLRKEQEMNGARGRLRGWLSGNLKLVAVSAISALAASAAVAIATVPDGDGTIHACYEILPATGAPKTGGPNLRIIDPSIAGAGQSCDGVTERPLDFSRQGPQGPAGIPGPTGLEGPQTKGGLDECATVVGHFKLNSTLQSDVCLIKQVKIGGSSAAVGAPNGPTTQFEFTRLTDGLSQKLFKATGEGNQFSSAKIQVYKPGTIIVVKTFSLSHASIISFKAGQGQNKPTDELTIAAIPKKGT